MNFYEQLFCRGRTTGEGMTHFERLFAAKFGGSPPPQVREYTGAVPVTITADGTPLLDFLISGNTVQNGTPSPDSPVMPEGTGERTGNLFDESTWNGVSAQRGTIEAVTNGFKLIATSDDCYSQTYASFAPSCSYAVTSGETYTLSWNIDNPNIYGIVFVFSGVSAASTPLTSVTASSKKVTFTIPSGHKYVAFRIGVAYSGDSLIYTKIMLNTGSTALPYEPYGYKIPISSANTTTPVYLGEVESTIRNKKLVLTGEEGWVRTQNQRCYYINASTGCPTDYLKQKITTSICSHYQSQNNTTSGSNEVEAGHFCFYTDGGCELYIGETTISSAADFKTYLAQQYAAGTPVTVWYVLTEPTTGIVNEPLMKIGNYADTLSKAQALVSIPTNNGSTTIDVDTTLKPSEVYIKYMG